MTVKDQKSCVTLKVLKYIGVKQQETYKMLKIKVDTGNNSDILLMLLLVIIMMMIIILLALLPLLLLLLPLIKW